jgi:hypothetical protein
MQAAATIALSAAHTCLVELALVYDKSLIADSFSNRDLAMVRQLPSAVWAAVHGDSKLAIAMDTFAAGKSVLLPERTIRHVPRSPHVPEAHRAIGLLDSVCTELGNGMPELGNHCSVSQLARIAETMINPVVSTVNGSSAAHRVEYCLLAGAESNMIPAAWVESELASWGRNHASVLADFGLARLLGWLRTGRLVNAGVSSDLTKTELDLVRATAGDLLPRPVAWFGTDVAVIQQLGLLDGMDPSVLEAFRVLHADGWDDTVASLIELVQTL